MFCVFVCFLNVFPDICICIYSSNFIDWTIRTHRWLTIHAWPLLPFQCFGTCSPAVRRDAWTSRGAGSIELICHRWIDRILMDFANLKWTECLRIPYPKSSSTKDRPESTSILPSFLIETNTQDLSRINSTMCFFEPYDSLLESVHPQPQAKSVSIMFHTYHGHNHSSGKNMEKWWCLSLGAVWISQNQTSTIHHSWLWNLSISFFLFTAKITHGPYNLQKSTCEFSAGCKIDKIDEILE